MDAQTIVNNAIIAGRIDPMDMAFVDKNGSDRAKKVLADAISSGDIAAPTLKSPRARY